MAEAIQNFKPEDYSRFLIREFLKKNGFEKTYEQFISEDTRPKVTMTKNQLTKLLGIEALMRRNSKSKVFTTMMDMICDYLIITKEATHGAGVQFPKLTSSSIQITQSKFTNDGMERSNTSMPQSSKPAGLPTRPQTSGGPTGGAKTQ